MKSSTELLRARLDELDINWWTDKYYRETNTCWRVGDFEWRASEEKDGRLLIGCTCVKYLTPEQAVAATVGVNSNTGEAIRKLLDKLNTELCNAGCVIECETREERQHLIDAVKDKYAQTIAATVGAGTCVDKDSDPNDFKCSACGAHSYIQANNTYTTVLDDHVTILKKFNYCPNCGRRIEVE